MTVRALTLTHDAEAVGRAWLQPLNPRTSPLRAPRLRDEAQAAEPVTLAARARDGNRRAFDRLWSRYASTVHAILLSMISDHEVEDLMQEVAVSALGSIRSLRNPESFPSWLCAIARNMGRNALTARRQSRSVVFNNLDAVEAPPRGDPMEADEIMAQLRTLPECYREPLVLRLMLELSGAEIAERTGMTPGSVRVNLCRGMKLLRAKLHRWEER